MSYSSVTGWPAGKKLKNGRYTIEEIPFRTGEDIDRQILEERELWND